MIFSLYYLQDFDIKLCMLRYVEQEQGKDVPNGKHLQNGKRSTTKGPIISLIL